MKLKQISLFVENKPGAISAPCRLLAKNGINISTLSLGDSKFFGILRLMIKDWETAKDLLEKNGFAVKVTDVIAVEADHKPGSLSHLLEILDKHAINLEYMYAFASGLNGKAVLIFRIEDIDNAIEKLRNEPEIHLFDHNSLFSQN